MVNSLTKSYLDMIFSWAANKLILPLSLQRTYLVILCLWPRWGHMSVA